MHELGITQQIVSIACERAGAARIKRLVVEIGKLSAVLPDSVRFCFDLCSQDTTADGATLEIIETPGLGRCRKCEAEVVMEDPFSRRGCGSTAAEVVPGWEHPR